MVESVGEAESPGFVFLVLFGASCISVRVQYAFVFPEALQQLPK
jgi:hypothetical protein